MKGVITKTAEDAKGERQKWVEERIASKKDKLPPKDHGTCPFMFYYGAPWDESKYITYLGEGFTEDALNQQEDPLFVDKDAILKTLSAMMSQSRLHLHVRGSLRRVPLRRASQ